MSRLLENASKNLTLAALSLALAAPLVGCGGDLEDQAVGLLTPDEMELATRQTAQGFLFFKPDLRVTFKSVLVIPTFPLGYYVTFKIDNLGISGASNISLSSTVDASQGNVGQVQYGHGAISYLESGASTQFTVRCPISSGWSCVRARLTASVSDELDPSDNSAAWTAP